MKSLWDAAEAEAVGDDLLDRRVHSSRLLGRDPALVLHGGGNTSVKISRPDFFGDPTDLLYVKGSGWDLASIERGGFAPVRLDVLRRMAELETLGDADMVREQRAAMTDPNAPNPSVEAILHALIPGRYVDHTHADAVCTISGARGGEQILRDHFGERVLFVPYVMPGFVLARAIRDQTRDVDWNAFEGMILLQHGVFTWGDEAKESYERMIGLVDEAEGILSARGVRSAPVVAEQPGAVSLRTVARLRSAVCRAAGRPMIGVLDQSPAAAGVAAREDAASLVTRGPVTPDHVIRTKQIALVVGEDPEDDVALFAAAYSEYFRRHAKEHHTALDPAPRWALLPGAGTLSFGSDAKGAHQVRDIIRHTLACIQQAEALGGWSPLSEADIFDMEYWELEQAKLRRTRSTPGLQGKVAVITGAAGGIGRATAEHLAGLGAAVCGLDLREEITELSGAGRLGLVCDLTDASAVARAVSACIEHFGGLDLLVSNAGNFPLSQDLRELDPDAWQRSLDLNLSSHAALLRETIPFLEHGIDPAVVLVGSRNVPAPGPGVAAYSVAKAGLTQLARVAALELAPLGVRVNVVHPDKVFDTELWSEEKIAARAKHYGVPAEAYKRSNLLGVEVRASDVAATIAALLGVSFRATTGAQVPVDGGSDRVV